MNQVREDSFGNITAHDGIFGINLENQGSSLEQMDQDLEDVWDMRYKSLEMEDAMIFKCDNWLRSCFEEEEKKGFEENDNGLNFDIDKSLKHCFDKIECEDEKKSHMTEGGDAFTIDNWLKSSFEGEEEEEKKKPIVIKIKRENESPIELDINVAGRKSSTSRKKCTNLRSNVTKKLLAKQNGNKGGKDKDRESKCLKKNPVLEQATVSKIAASCKCVFKCSKCAETHSSWAVLTTHMKKKHKEKISASNFELFLVKATVHNCRICSKAILCDSDFLKNHLVSCHSLNIGEYRKLYNCDMDWKRKNQEILQTARCSENIIGNFCTFKCIHCNKYFKSMSALTSHTSVSRSRSGNCTKKLQVNQLCDYLDKAVTHKCKICSELILCDNEFIKQHASNTHGIKNVTEYCAQTGCKVESKVEEVASAKGGRTKKSVGNFCKYTCQKCGFVAQTWYCMSKHLKSKSHWSSSGKRWLIYINKVVMHQCLTCKKTILNERTFLEDHLRKNHQETLPEYVKRYNIVYRKSS